MNTIKSFNELPTPPSGSELTAESIRGRLDYLEAQRGLKRSTHPKNVESKRNKKENIKPAQWTSRRNHRDKKKIPTKLQLDVWTEQEREAAKPLQSLSKIRLRLEDFPKNGGFWPISTSPPGTGKRGKGRK